MPLSPQPIDAELFRQVLSRFASGVTVVTARVGGELGGMTVSAFSSVALDPPLVLVCLTIDKPLTKLVVASEAFGVSMLAADQEDVSDAFAYRDVADRFDGIAWHEGPRGMPLLDGALATLECDVVQTHPAGDHLIVVGRAISGWAGAGHPLVYTQHGYRRLAR